MKETREKILEHLSKEIKTRFSDELEFAFIFGSWARSENRSDSDIDLMIVFKDQKIQPKEIDKFKKKFIEFQLNNHLTPDKNYPGEYISISNVRKAIDGYGFVKNENVVEIPTINSSQWNQFNEYRQWLSALAGPSIFLTGNKQKYEDLKRESLTNIILVTLLSRNSDSFKLDEVIGQLLEGGKEYLGFCDTSYTYEYLITNLPTILDSLLDKKLVEPLNTDREFVIKRNSAFEKLIRLSEQNDITLRKNFLGSTTTGNEKEILRQCLEIGISFVLDDKEKVFNYYPEDQIRNRFMDKIPSVGKEMDEIIKEFQGKILDGSIRQSSGNYLAFPDSGNAISALAADILISFTNQNLIATTKSAPTATFVEIQVIQWLRELIGYKNINSFPKNAIDAGGIMTSSGTQANATAMLAARCKSFPESREKGLSSLKIKPILIVAADTLYHYSHIASFWGQYQQVVPSFNDFVK